MGKLPFLNDYFSHILSQHVIEHLEMERELLPIFSEFHRILKRGGEVWLSCPSIEKICNSYIHDRAASLIKGRQSRFPSYSTRGYPPVVTLNSM
ncbi:MAG: methyltransferase domain-containing protein [Gammaproteobacteria bacterium]|nr:methyltransferase domain-containing protein [Gammaproteobacteria bacterium]